MPDDTSLFDALKRQVSELSASLENLTFSFYKKTGADSNSIQGSKMQSVNFATGVAGWELTPDGNLEANNGVFRGTLSASSLIIAGALIATKGTFGGNGADGALTITSGTTTISAGSATSLVKNYTSISITSTGKLAFSLAAASGTVIILKSQGAVTITSGATCIDASAMGADGGAGGTGTTGAGSDGTSGAGYDYTTNPGIHAGTLPDGGAGGALVTTFSIQAYNIDLEKYRKLLMGSGGGGGSTVAASAGNAQAGAGGKGGGVLIIECAGAWNFTTASGISVAGAGGVAGGPSSGGGGGGGSGGYFLGIYNTLTANTGTIVTTGGTGGNKDAGNGVSVGGGGGGGFIVAGSAGTTSSTASGKTGGDGAVGFSTVVLNTSYA